ncbi:MAG TPA: deoxyribodipyrimidine photo-lyase [Gemmatimonadaceae bacterium]|nr:deoxyribodipyrimidine photo-lyase [Gemmatimonadaceae bacterium]
MHPLGSPYVRDQIAQRSARVNEMRLVPEGELVLYLMHSTQRIHENWALRYATIEADRLNRPLLIVHELDSDYEHASDRMHTFALQGARDVARDAEAMGYTFRFLLRRRRGEPSRAIERIAARACLIITDAYPTGGSAQRTARLGRSAPCRVVSVDSVGVIPAAMLPREEYAARTIRPKLARLRDIALEPVLDRAPRRDFPATLLASLAVDSLDIARADIAGEVARCEVDRTVAPAPIDGGTRAGRARLARFVDTGLQQYSTRRADPTDPDGSSRLSPYLRYGQISAAEVARAALQHAPPAEAEAFLDEMITWRELSLNFCLHNAAYGTLGALPTWVHRSMGEHESDRRDTIYTREQLANAATGEPLWNAGQRELLATGQMHNAVRMLWGKSVLLWTDRYADALSYLIWLNDRYALDGRDPNSYSNILWCFGKFDRPFATRPVWGTIRPMSLSRAKAKFDVNAYVDRWCAPRAEVFAAAAAGGGERKASRRRRPSLHGEQALSD